MNWRWYCGPTAAMKDECVAALHRETEGNAPACLQAKRGRFCRSEGLAGSMMNNAMPQQLGRCRFTHCRSDSLLLKPLQQVG